MKVEGLQKPGYQPQKPPGSNFWTALENHEISSFFPRPQQTKNAMPEPPKMALKSMKNRPWQHPRAIFAAILRTLIFDDSCMNFNGFSLSGGSWQHPKAIKNESRNDTINIGGKTRCPKHIFFENGVPKGLQKAPKIS